MYYYTNTLLDWMLGPEDIEGLGMFQYARLKGRSGRALVVECLEELEVGMKIIC